MRSLDDIKTLAEIGLLVLVVGALLYYKGDISAALSGAKKWLFATQLPGPGQQPGSNLAGWQVDPVTGAATAAPGGVIAGGFGGGGGDAF